MDWRLIAAILTSSLFALSAESYGNATMGAGALEIATKKVPELRVVDVRTLTATEKQTLIALAEEAWDKSPAMDWGTREEPDAPLKALDSWLLKACEVKLPLSKVYADIVATVRSRVMVARDKDETTKSHQRIDVAAVATSIADIVRVISDSKQFPEAFYEPGTPTIPFDFSGAKSLELDCIPILHEAVVTVRNAGSDEQLLNAQYPRSVAQVIVKALLLGRRQFTAPESPSAAEQALQTFDTWMPSIMDKLEESVRASAVGTRYEQQVLDACLRSLSLDSRATEPEFYGHARIQ
jgi:hypothetical protein